MGPEGAIPSSTPNRAKSLWLEGGVPTPVHGPLEPEAPLCTPSWLSPAQMAHRAWHGAGGLRQPLLHTGPLLSLQGRMGKGGPGASGMGTCG